MYHVDEHIPDLIAIPSDVEITQCQAYRTGQLILQDKASCFPAYLLRCRADGGVVIDACAAPGNKTTHLAAILAENAKLSADGRPYGKVIACEKDASRSQTLEKMVDLAGVADVVALKQKQDFTKLNPDGREYTDVTALLLDPSCSGSGMIGRDGGSGIPVHLPSTTAMVPSSTSKKRKRTAHVVAATSEITPAISPADSAITGQAPSNVAEDTADKLAARLDNLSAFQLRLLQHAMAFPSAQRIVYSTCSIHSEENEHVLVAALRSPIAREQGWRVLRRADQVEGLRKWRLRGQRAAIETMISSHAVSEQSCNDQVKLDVDELTEACIRCDKDGEDGTMGFFVVGFERDAERETGEVPDSAISFSQPTLKDAESDDTAEEWKGFED